MRRYTRRRARSPGRALSGTDAARDIHDEESNYCKLIAVLVLIPIVIIVINIIIFNQAIAISDQANMMNKIPINLRWPICENNFGFAEDSLHYKKLEEIKNNMSTAQTRLQGMCEESFNNLSDMSACIAFSSFIQIWLCGVMLWAQWHKFWAPSD